MGMSKKKGSPSQGPHIVAISVSDRYFSTEKLQLLSGWLRSNELPKFCEVHWPPPLLEPTPELYSRFFSEALGLDKKILEKSKFFVDSPITLAKNLIRESERDLPDIDPENFLVGASLKDNNLTSRNRSSLELFRALLEVSEWQEIFRIKQEVRNLYEVHLGPLAEFELAGDKTRRGKPQESRVPKKLSQAIAKFHKHTPNEIIRGRKRLHMTYLIGYSWLMQDENCPWRLFGSKLFQEHGVWREGEVIGFDMEPYKSLSLNQSRKQDDTLPDILSLYKKNTWTINKPRKNLPKSCVEDDVQITYDQSCTVSRFAKQNKSFSSEKKYDSVTIDQSLKTRLEENPSKYFRIHPCSLSVPSSAEPTYVYLCTWARLRFDLMAEELTVTDTDESINKNGNHSTVLILIAILEKQKPTRNQSCSNHASFSLREIMHIQGKIKKNGRSIRVTSIIYLNYCMTQAKSVQLQSFDKKNLPRLISFDQYEMSLATTQTNHPVLKISE